MTEVLKEDEFLERVVADHPEEEVFGPARS
jgi:hypothetical protein